jgi:hypothetical protein
VLIRYLWQFKTVVFLHWCQIFAVLFQAEIYINLLDDEEFDVNDGDSDDDDNDANCDARQTSKAEHSDVETESTLSTIHSRHVTPSHSKHTTPR